MEKRIESKLKSWLIILMMFIPTLLFLIGVTTMVVIIKKLQQGNPVTLNKCLILVLLFSLFVVLRHILLRAYPKVIISSEGIRFKRILRTELYRWEDIYDIKLTGKLEYWYSTLRQEATVIQLQDQRKIPIWIDAYRNISEMRMALQSMYLSEKSGDSVGDLEFESKSKSVNNILDVEETGETYKGNHLISYCGIASYVFMGAVLFIGNEVVQLPADLFLYFFMSIIGGVFAVGWWAMVMHLSYFETTPHYIIVRNQIFWWQKKVYNLADIKELVIDGTRRAVSLRIITRELEDYVYPAGSLRSAQWRSLIQDLRAKGVTVRDEAFGGLTV